MLLFLIREVHFALESCAILRELTQLSDQQTQLATELGIVSIVLCRLSTAVRLGAEIQPVNMAEVQNIRRCYDLMDQK